MRLFYTFEYFTKIKLCKTLFFSNEYINKTMEGKPGADFIRAEIKEKQLQAQKNQEKEMTLELKKIVKTLRQ
mgnify:CR=1 FL=1